MAVKMLNPKKEEYIIDPASGSGGFLIHAMHLIWDNDLSNASRETKINFAGTHVYGIDFAETSVKISRALMLIAGDGKSHIFKLNSLSSHEWQGDEKEKLRARADLGDRLLKFNDYSKDSENEKNFKYFNFDLLLTNPPFAGEIIDRSTLNDYDLAKNDKGKLRNKMERHILFVKARILAVVGLHVNTFKPHAGTKTSVLFLQKRAEGLNPPGDYPIFMAV